MAWLGQALKAQEVERDRQLSSRDLTAKDLQDIGAWHLRECEFLKSLRIILSKNGMGDEEWGSAANFEAKKCYILGHLTANEKQKLLDTDPIRQRPDDWLWRA